MHLSLGGGEPTVREDLIPVVKYATRYIPSVGLVTNGYLLDEKFTSKLAQAGLRQVMVSLDGVKPETHDANRGEGSFEKAIQAIKNCLREDMATRISFTISQTNFSELKDVLALALAGETLTRRLVILWRKTPCVGEGGKKFTISKVNQSLALMENLEEVKNIGQLMRVVSG